jgi:hypothetical protein
MPHCLQALPAWDGQPLARRAIGLLLGDTGVAAPGGSIVRRPLRDCRDCPAEPARNLPHA